MKIVQKHFSVWKRQDNTILKVQIYCRDILLSFRRLLLLRAMLSKKLTSAGLTDSSYERSAGTFHSHHDHLNAIAGIVGCCQMDHYPGTPDSLLRDRLQAFDQK